MGVNVTDDVAIIFLPHVFLQEVLEGMGMFSFLFFFCSSSTLFHIHAPTHAHTSDLPAVNHSPTLLTSAQLVSGREGMNALLRGTQLQDAEGAVSFTSWLFFALSAVACLDKEKEQIYCLRKSL